MQSFAALWERGRLALAGVLLAGALVWSAIPGGFTIDENSYLSTLIALQHGHFVVPGTDGLTPSPELIWFDPQKSTHQVTRTPVYTVAPPFWAFFALPLAPLGWRGLVALNVLSFLIVGVLVFRFVVRYHGSRTGAWFAAFTVCVATYLLEYVQGLWPHLLSVALCLGAFCAAADVRDRPRARSAVLAGLLLGAATGIRYQNVAFAAMVGLGLWLWSRRRWRMTLAFVASYLVLIAALAAINKSRLDSYNPVSKGKGYATTNLAQPQYREKLLSSGILSVWARLIDHAAWPPIGRAPTTAQSDLLHQLEHPKPLQFRNALKKGLTQSAPWVLLALAGLVLGLRARDGIGPWRLRRELWAIALIIGGVLGMFALFGVRSHSGWCYNMRYLMELVPLLAIALATTVGPLPRGRVPLVAALLGAVSGVVGASLLARPATPLAQSIAMNTPIVLGCALVLAWLFQRRAVVLVDARRSLSVALLATSLTWAVTLHLSEDVFTSRLQRRRNAASAARLDKALPHTPLVLFACGATTDAFGPLLLSRDIVVVDPCVDSGGTVAPLVRELLARQRRIFVVRQGMANAVHNRLMQSAKARLVPAESSLTELLP